MLYYTDQTGQTISLASQPKRIISLVPSQSELLWELGLRDELVGITKFCIHPDEMFKTKERVGGTKNLNLDKIRALKPDLIIGNKEENERSQIEILQKEFKVWMSDIYTVNDALGMITQLGKICGKENATFEISHSIQTSFSRMKNLFNGHSIAYFIWNKPYMIAATDTFIDYVLNHLGLYNAFADLKRYPELTAEALKNAQPEFCFLSSEPFPFKEQHIIELQKILPASKILIVDGAVFSWYGTRLLHLEKYVTELKDRMNS